MTGTEHCQKNTWQFIVLCTSNKSEAVTCSDLPARKRSTNRKTGTSSPLITPPPAPFQLFSALCLSKLAAASPSAAYRRNQSIVADLAPTPDFQPLRANPVALDSKRRRELTVPVADARIDFLIAS